MGKARQKKRRRRVKMVKLPPPRVRHSLHRMRPRGQRGLLEGSMHWAFEGVHREDGRLNLDDVHEDMVV